MQSVFAYHVMFCLEMKNKTLQIMPFKGILCVSVTNNFMLLLFTRPLPRDGGMAEDHGAPEAEQLPRVWTRGRKEIESRQRVSGAKSP